MSSESRTAKTKELIGEAHDQYHIPKHMTGLDICLTQATMMTRSSIHRLLCLNHLQYNRSARNPNDIAVTAHMMPSISGPLLSSIFDFLLWSPWYVVCFESPWWKTTKFLRRLTPGQLAVVSIDVGSCPRMTVFRPPRV